jgi:hypothetical protein
LYSQCCSIPVGFQLLIFGVTSRKYFNRQAEEFAYRAEVVKLLLGLDTLCTMSQINMLDLMPKHGGKSIFTLYQRQQTCSHKDGAPGTFPIYKLLWW